MEVVLMANDNDLIRRGDLKNLLLKRSFFPAIVAAALKEIPKVDAVEVVHGRWEKQSGIYSCSECGKACPYDVQADVIEYWPCNYCPNCGAKMDGERKDND
jgi:hypothetical protein